jgi:hypothetical protein
VVLAEEAEEEVATGSREIAWIHLRVLSLLADTLAIPMKRVGLLPLLQLA